MKNTILFSIIFTLLIASSGLFFAEPAKTQGLSYAEISQPDLSTFPTVTTYLDAFNAEGTFVDGVTAGEVTILENGVEKKPSKINQLQTPLHFILAVNSSQSLAIRDAAGNSRYSKIVKHLTNWIDTMPADVHDSMSLVWNGGVVASQLNSLDWKNKLGTFDPQLNTSTSSLAALSFALDVAQNSPASPGIKTAILLVSGHLNNADSAGLKDLLARANQSRVRVFVLATDGKDYYKTAGIQELFKMANSTGARYETFTGSEAITYPEKWLAPLRSVYELSYVTDLRSEGDVSFAVQVNHKELVLSSQLLHFKLDLRPPQVTLLSPPIEILRDNPSNRFDQASYYPKEVRISALIEFPDKKFRTIKRTTLFVDGVRTVENLTEPFNAFTWNINEIQVSAYHNLRIEVEDVYGLVSSSSEVPVKVVVAEPPGGILGRLVGNNFAVLVIGLIVLAGFGLRKVWLQRRSEKPKEEEKIEPPKPKQVKQYDRHEPIKVLIRESENKVLPWLSKQKVSLQAHLLPLNEDGTPSGGSIIYLNDEMLKIGSDPKMAGVVIADRSVAKYHARIIRNEAGEFVVYDERSLTGTWVNYSSVHEGGRVLEKDDILNFGNVCYRFVQDDDTPKQNSDRSGVQ